MAGRNSLAEAVYRSRQAPRYRMGDDVSDLSEKVLGWRNDVWYRAYATLVRLPLSEVDKERLPSRFGAVWE